MREAAQIGTDRLMAAIDRAGAVAVKPLLVIDGDSLAHRAYHALPKTIKRAGGKQSGAIVGFTNFLVRLWETEQPRSVVVGWDTLEVPTYRHEAYEPYQSGRVFDPALLEQLPMLPELVQALGFTAAKAPGYEADDFLAAAVAAAKKKRWPALVVTSDRDSFQLASKTGDDPHADARRERARPDRPGRGAGALRRRAEAGAGLHRAARRPVGQAPGRARRRAEAGRRDPPRARLARGRAEGGPVRPDRGGTCASTGE